jgi:hypothetical protein
MSFNNLLESEIVKYVLLISAVTACLFCCICAYFRKPKKSLVVPKNQLHMNPMTIEIKEAYK